MSDRKQWGLIGAYSLLFLGLANCQLQNFALLSKDLSKTRADWICPFEGIELTLQVKPSQEFPTVTSALLETVAKVLKKRLENLEISESAIKTIGQDTLIVQLRGITQSIREELILTSPSRLEFRIQKHTTEDRLRAKLQEREEILAHLKKLGNLEYFANNYEPFLQNQKAIAALYEPATLTNKNIKNADVQTESTGNWIVAIDFDTEGGELFAAMTKRVAGTGRTIGIFLDNELISAPAIGPEYAATGITGGKAVIHGNFTAQEANDMTIELRSGALPTPVETIAIEQVKNNRCKD